MKNVRLRIAVVETIQSPVTHDGRWRGKVCAIKKRTGSNKYAACGTMKEREQKLEPASVCVSARVCWRGEVYFMCRVSGEVCI